MLNAPIRGVKPLALSRTLTSLLGPVRVNESGIQTMRAAVAAP